MARRRPDGASKLIAPAVLAFATLVAALVTAIWIQQSQTAASYAVEPSITPSLTVTATETVFPTETPTSSGATPRTQPPSPRVTVTVTTGPDVRVVLPSSMAISIDSGAPSGDSSGFITALGGFLTGIGAVITGLVTWLNLRRRRGDDEDEESEKKPAA